MFSLWFLLHSWSQVSEKVGQRRQTHGQHAADIFKQHLGTLALLLNNISIITIMHWTSPPAPVHTKRIKKHSAHQLADFGMCLLNFEAEEGQGVCPAAQWGHFHLNRGPWVPSGVTLATVITIVPAVWKREAPMCLPEESLTSKRTKYLSWVQAAPKEQTCQASLSQDKLNDWDICLATADTTAKCQSIFMGNLGYHVKFTDRLIFRQAATLVRHLRSSLAHSSSHSGQAMGSAGGQPKKWV